MIKILCIAVLGVLISSGASAAPYLGYDAKKILESKPDATGKLNHSLNFQYLDNMLEGIERHAGNYPPQFDSEEQQQRGAQDIHKLAGMLNILVESSNASPQLLLRAAEANRVAHNLDIPGAADHANKHFQSLLRIEPNNNYGNYQYGRFLSETGSPQQGIPYLQKAWDLGVVEAGFGLALSIFSLGDKEQATKILSSYIQKNPEDTNATKVLEAMKSGKLQMKSNLSSFS